MLGEAKYHLNQNHVHEPIDFEGFRLHQIGRLHCGSGMEVANHRHDDWFEITAATEGNGEVFTDGCGTHVRPGDLYLSFPGDVHAIRSSKSDPLKYDFFSFNTSLSPYKEELEALMHRLSPEMRLFSDRRINACIEQLTVTVEKNGRYATLLGAALIREILLYILEDFDRTAPEAAPFGAARSTKPSAKELCFQLMNYIQTHIFTMKSLSELAALTGYNYSYLSALFKKCTSQTLRSYYSEKRLEAAKTLLKEEHMTAVRAAELVGYASASAFGKAYKARYGISPLEKEAEHASE